MQECQSCLSRTVIPEHQRKRTFDTCRLRRDVSSQLSRLSGITTLHVTVLIVEGQKVLKKANIEHLSGLPQIMLTLMPSGEC